MVLVILRTLRSESLGPDLVEESRQEGAGQEMPLPGEEIGPVLRDEEHLRGFKPGESKLVGDTDQYVTMAVKRDQLRPLFLEILLEVPIAEDVGPSGFEFEQHAGTGLANVRHGVRAARVAQRHGLLVRGHINSSASRRPVSLRVCARRGPGFGVVAADKQSNPKKNVDSHRCELKCVLV